MLVVSASPTELPLVMLDPGHGGAQRGARGVCGCHEKDVVLAVGQALRSLLNASGRVRAKLTRDSDLEISLSDRAGLANTQQAALFVSIHANASKNARAHGIETFFLSRRTASARLRELVRRENGPPLPRQVAGGTLSAILQRLSLSANHHESQRLAVRLQKTMGQRLSYHGRGVLQAPFVVLKEAHMPAALVELGFLTNPGECRLLASTEHQRAVAQALAAAILTHMAQEALGAAGDAPS